MPVQINRPKALCLPIRYTAGPFCVLHDSGVYSSGQTVNNHRCNHGGNSELGRVVTSQSVHKEIGHQTRVSRAMC